jgi:hypothetical protein
MRIESAPFVYLRGVCRDLQLVEHGEAGGAAGEWVVQRVPATRMPVIEEAVGAQSLVAHDGKAVPASAVESRDLVSKVKLDGSSHVTYWIDVEVGLLARNT